MGYSHLSGMEITSALYRWVHSWLRPFLRCGADRAAGITLQPIPNHVVIELLGPEHSSKALAHHVLCVRREILRNDGAIELVCFKSAEREGLVEAVERVLPLKSEFARRIRTTAVPPASTVNW